MKFGQKLTFLQVRTFQKCQKWNFAKISHFCTPGPVKNVKNEIWPKFQFLQVRTCQKCQKWNLAKISHFCRSGPVENVKNEIWPKTYIFAGPDLSKMSKVKFGQKLTFLQVRTCQKCQKWNLAKIFTFLQVRTCQKCKKWNLAKNLHFCRSGPFKNVKIEISPKFHIFARPDLSKMSKMKFGQNFNFCRSGPVKNLKNEISPKFQFLKVWTCQKCQKWKLAKIFTFLQVRTCQKCQKWDLAKISIFAGPDLSKMSKMKFGQNFNFCRSGTVVNVKNEIWPKIHIFAGPDLSKMSKMKFGKKRTFLQVRTCRKCQKWNLAKNLHFCRSGPVKNVKNEIWPKFHIFAGSDLSKMSKIKFGQNFTFLQVWNCRKCQKWNLAKISHFCRSRPVKNVKNEIWPKTYIFAGPDLSKMSKMKFGQNFTFLQVRTCQKCQKWNLAKTLHFCRSGPVKNVKNEIWPKTYIFAGPDLSKMSKMKFRQNFNFWRSGPVKNVKSENWPKFSHFCRSGPVKNVKNEIWPKFQFLQVRTCQKCQKWNLAKISIFAGPELS